MDRLGDANLRRIITRQDAGGLNTQPFPGSTGRNVDSGANYTDPVNALPAMFMLYN